MPEEQSFAHDERSQQLAEAIEQAQSYADAELKACRSSKSPALKVGAAMQHSRWQIRADKHRADLIEHTGMQI